MIINIIRDSDGTYKLQDMEDLGYHTLDEMSYMELIEYRVWLHNQLGMIKDILN